VTSTPATSTARRVGYTSSNLPAFLFGPFSVLAKRMWRRGLTLIAGAVAIAVGLVVSDVPYSVARAICSGIAAANITNYSYYLHVVRHIRSWHFLEGFGRRTAPV
jgi:hypothetical protein